MILRFLKSNSSTIYLLFPIIGLLLWMESFVAPKQYPFFPGEAEALLYRPFIVISQNNLLLSNILALVMAILIALLVQQVNNRYDFIRIRTMLPAPLFIIMISGLIHMHSMHPVYPATVFLLLAIYRLFSAYDKSKPYSIAFDSGFILGIGVLFYYNLIFVFPAFFFGIAILSRENRWRELVIVFIGLLLPLIFGLTYAVVTDQFQETLRNFMAMLFTPNKEYDPDIQALVLLGYLVLLTITGSIKIIQQYDTRKVSTRKYFQVFFLIFTFSLLSFIFVPAAGQEILVVTAVPLTFLISNFFVFLRSRFWGELLFGILLIIIIAIQFMN